MNLNGFERLVIDWAKDRQLLSSDNTLMQYAKLAEEFGELGRAILKKDKAGVKDGIGDCMVVLAILAHQAGMSLPECADAAWNEIKERRGRTVGGTFIKETE